MPKKQEEDSKNNTPLSREEDVLRRMLGTPPKPQGEKPKKKPTKSAK
jgi:hypothetical protein